MENLLEKFIALINANMFYKEFSFTKNQFTPVGASELEFADHVIWLEGVLIIYQLKERNIDEKESTEKTERNWFEDTVITLGTKQIRRTLKYLKDHSDISIENQRGHKFNISQNNITKVFKIILYKNSLPKSFTFARNRHISQTADFIHIIAWKDYVEMSQIFQTPIEMMHYLEGREFILRKNQTQVSELALLGQHISGHLDEEPHAEYIQYVSLIKLKRLALKGLFSSLYDLVDWKYEGSTINDYYVLLTEVAKLNTAEFEQLGKIILDTG